MKKIKLILLIILILSFKNIYAGLGFGIGTSYGGLLGVNFTGILDNSPVNVISVGIGNTIIGTSYNINVGKTFSNNNNSVFGLSYGVVGAINDIFCRNDVCRGDKKNLNGLSIFVGGSTSEKLTGLYGEAKFVIISDKGTTRNGSKFDPAGSLFFSVGYNF